MLWKLPLIGMLSISFTLAMSAVSSLAAEPTKHVASFDDNKRPSDWGVNFGHWEPADGALVVRQLAADNHAAASRWRIPIQDGTVRLKAKFAGATALHIGFDPKPGSLKKQGHLYSLVVTPAEASIKKHRDKADAASKDVTLATANIAAPADGWLPIELRTEGDRVSVTIGSGTKLEATDPSFHVEKPTVVFRVIGGDVQFDDVEVTVTK
jgi:hypothetical protein